MKVDTSRLKKGTSEVPTECQTLIDKLRSCSMDELLEELRKIDTWTFGKSELYHWIDVLDIFDGILEEATKQIGNDWFLACDERFSPKKIQLLLAVLNFTTLLIEHSFSRHLYNSVEHLTQLLSSTNMEIVLGVLNLLYMFSKRSNFIPRLNCAKRNALLARLTYIAESWGGKEHGYGLAECCHRSMKITDSFPKFYYEYYDSDGKLKSIEQDEFSSFIGITNPSEIAYLMCCRIPIPLDDDQKMLIFTRVRLSLAFHDYETRLQFVLARLQALSVLVYSNSLQDNINTLLYPGFLEELVELLEMREGKLVEIRAAALRTLTSIIHLDRNPNFPKKSGSRLMMIIDVTGASSYHGFLPTLVRTCIQHLTMTPSEQQQLQSTNSASSHHQQQQQQQQFPLALATALFSFLYHLASYDSGGEALVACGMMESLLRVINWPGKELEHITFVTRAVRVIDLITNIEMQSFQNHGGLQSFIGRLEMEVNLCREEQPSELIPSNLDRAHDNNFVASEDVTMCESSGALNSPGTPSQAPNATNTSNNTSTVPVNNSASSNSSSTSSSSCSSSYGQSKNCTRSCLPQRAALLKSMLNFLKKAIQDAAFSESIRHVMESSLPTSLRHIISNAEYYGPSLFLLATDVVTVYVFQEPSLLYSLQDSGLTDVVLQALLKKDVPPTREVLGSLPNVFSALCLNSRGLQAFVQYKPFDRLFEVLLSPVYLQAMRRRRSSDPIGDTAANLGNAMDELMRHQPSLKTEATKAIIRLLEELVKLGTDEKYICWRSQNNKCDDSSNGSNNNLGSVVNSSSGGSSSGSSRPSIHVRVLHVNNAISRGVNSHDPVDSVRSNIGASNNSNVETGSEDDEEDEESTSSHHNQRDVAPGIGCSRSGSQDNSNGLQANGAPMKIPLIDYILNVMKFVDAILSNNSTDDHCREFVAQGGLQPLLRILSLPNLPVDSPITASAQAVAAVCKSILSLAHEPQVLKVSLEQLAAVVDQLEPLQSHWEQSQGSVLLRELANCKNIESAFSNASETPLLHAMSAVHGYVVMLVHVCRTGQTEIRNLLIEQWGQNNKYGQKLLYKLVQLYTALVWESTLLLALCTDDIIPVGCDFGKEDLDKLGEPPSAPVGTSGTSAAPMPSEVSLDTPMPSTSTQSSAAAASINDLTMDIDRVLNSTLDGESSSSGTSKFDSAFSNAAGNASTSSSKQSTNIQRRIVATPSQLRYIKSLLGASSRLGRALAELFGLLVKLCVGNRMRMRHPQNVTAYMSSASRDIARVLSYILVDGLSHDQLPPSPIPKLKQTFLICSIGFTSPMLFDEKRYAYHLMLHKFCEEGGLQAFFEMFGFALSLEPDTNAACSTESNSNSKLPSSNNEINENNERTDIGTESTTPVAAAKTVEDELMQGTSAATAAVDTLTAGKLIVPKEVFTNSDEHGEFSAGSGEFLDAWLMLLEKMVNPKAVLESQHVIATKSLRNKPEFDTVSYLINVHILAFQTVTKIWSFKPIRTYGARMTESMLTIMKHIYQGEPILREKYNKKITEQTTTSSTNNDKAPKFGSLFARSQTENDTPNRLGARSGGSGHRSSGSTMANANSTINEAFLTQLMEMGFSQEHCREALYHTGSVEQATEYLLAHTGSTGANNANENATGMGLDSDDDENIDAEMMVLMGQKISGSGDTSLPTDGNKAESSGAGAGTFSKRNRRGMRNTAHVLPNQPPLSEQLLSDFAEEAVRTSLYLIDQVPDAVFKGTELLGILFKRNEIKWKMLATIISTMIDCAEQLRAMLTDRVTPIETIFFGEIGCRFTVRLHIFCLFLEMSPYHDLRTPVILSMKEFKLMPKLISLLNETEDVLTSKAGKCLYTPKWLSQMILLIDLYEKVVVSIRRRNEMHRITTNTWKWYDVQSGKWNAYTNGNNKIINDAYNNGETTVRVSVGRQRYTINFNCMSQVNEETGNHRPVVLGLLSSVSSPRVSNHVSTELSYILSSDNEDTSNVNVEEQKPKLNRLNKKTPTLTEATSVAAPLSAASLLKCNQNQLDRATTAAISEMRDSHLKNRFRTYYTQSVANNTKKDSNVPTVGEDDAKLLGLEEFSTENIVATCVRLMSPRICVDRDSLHALMMLCVRLTTKYENAEVFAREGGIKLLLEMKQSGGYLRASTLANLLIRHTLEEPRTLATAMEKVIAARTLQTIPPGYRDLIFMLRRMSSAVARDPDIFKEVARSMLRIDINTLRRGVFSEDNRLIMKSVPSPNAKRTTEKPNENSIAVKVVYDLLQALIVPANANQKQTFEEKVVTNAAKNHSRHTNTSASFSSTTNSVSTTATFGSNNNNSNYLVEDNDLSFIAMSFGGPSDSHSSHSSRLGSMHLISGGAGGGGGGGNSSSNNDPSTSNKSQNSLLNDGWNSNVANSKGENDKPLLSKLTILKALAEAVRSYQSVGVIIAEYTYQPNTLIRKPTPALAFILDNLLPSTEQNPDRECSSGARMLIAALSASDSQVTQYTVVTEVRAAILRALTWPEIPEKHAQLQLLTALIPTMIENCPPDQNPALMRLQQTQPRRNDIFNIMVRKGLIADLANITQSLDLSSPHTIVTIGTALKSLEQLLRMSNQSASTVPIQFNKNRTADAGDSTVNNPQNLQIDENTGQPSNETPTFDENVANDNSADDEQVNDNDNENENENDNDNEVEDDNANANEVQNVIAGESDENDPSAPIIDIDSPINVNEAEAQDFMDNPRVDVQPIDSTMLDEIRRRILDRDLIDHEPSLSRPSIASDRSNVRGVAASVVNAANSASNTGGHPPIELAEEERFILEEDDTSSDSDSNGSEENDEEREEESNGEDENEDEAEDRSDLEGDEETRQYIEMYDVYGRHLSPSIPELERDNEDILMIQYADNGRDGGSNNAVSANSVGVSVNVNVDVDNDQPSSANSNVPSTSGINRSNFPNIFESSNMNRHEEGVSANGDASNESASGSQSTSNVIGRIHITTSNSRSGGIGPGSNQPNSLTQLIQFRAQRSANRQRRCGYLNLNGRNTNPPAILQRLLGPVAQNVNIGLGQVIANANGSASFRDATRVVVMDNGIGILSNSGEPSIDIVDQAGYLFGRSLAATLNQTPSPLHWWLEEAKALGIESQADVCLTVCNELIPELEAQRSLELSKTRSKRKKKSPGESNVKQTTATKQKTTTSNQTESSDVASALAAASATGETASHDNEIEENQQNSEAQSGSDVEDESDDDDSSEKNDDELDIENQNQNLAEDRADDDDDESDDNEDDDDEEDEDDVIQMPLRSYVESNEEMTESDCNVHEDDERTGGGSASDSGHSIASSVSTEPFFSGQSVAAEMQPIAETNATQAIENQTDTSVNNNVQTTPQNLTEPTTSQAAVVQPDDTNESLDTVELKDHESVSNDDMADKSDVINVYSSGDEDDAESADRKRQRLNSEQDESQTTPTENDTEQREDTEQTSSNSQSGLIVEAIPLAESETIEADRSSADPAIENIAGAASASFDALITEESSDVNASENVAASSDAGAAASATANSNESGEGTSAAAAAAQIDGTPVPDGIDPSFLAALPEEMRAEVIAEHLRIQRMQERTRLQQQVAVQNEQQTVAEVNPEFLAALPPSIQEEVLQQQRLEQQRLAAAAANPNDPVDAAAFFQNLQPSLRQAILTDMEESQISVLPPELAAEAQNLRRDWESRNRQMMQEQISQIGAGGNNGNVGTSPSFSSVLRYRSRLPEPISSVNYLQRMRWNNWPINPGSTAISVDRDVIGGSSLLCMEQQGQPQLDHESLTSLLILLFVEANKICTLRFHRVIRILCSHIPTRDWIIRTILSIIERSNLQSRYSEQLQAVSNRPHWLNIRLDAALGNRNNIFIIKKIQNDTEMQVDGASTSASSQYTIAIHPQAAQIVCRHALELLISLAKNFPSNFLPIKKKSRSDKAGTSTIDESQPSTSGSGRSQKDTTTDKSTDFWDILLRLEMRARNGKTFNSRDSSTNPARSEDFADIEMNSFSESPFGQLISMLSFNIILKSTLLTDRLLKLLSYISVGLPDAVQLASTISSLPEAPLENATNEPAEANATDNNVAAENTTASAGQTVGNRLKSNQPIELDEKCLPESQDSLRLAIEVLTSKSCSEEGLEDATSLLLNLSQCSNVTRTFILNLLIDGAKYLAVVVQAQINDLIYDLRQLNQRNRSESGLSPSNSQQMPLPESDSVQQASTSNAKATSAGASSSGGGAAASKGVLQDRFTKETVVITSTSKQKARCELQLPSMVPLISKTASQSFFLRILKVVIQIRESAKEALAKETSSQQQQQQGTAQSTPQQQQQQQQQNQLQQPQQPAKKILLSPIESQPLSETLQLDHLWNTLSDCLVELEENADHHAVLVLQPAVEAFFLVHASTQQQSSQSTEQKKLPNRAANVSDALRPNAENAAETSNISNVPDTNEAMETSSDAAASSAGAATAASADAEASGIADNEQSEMVISPISMFGMADSNGGASAQEASNNILTRLIPNVAQQQAPKVQLTSDQKKFLQFAEKHRTVLNQILRQSTVHLSDGPFAVLVDHTRILDFDVKRRYFRTELERMDEGIRREELAVHVHRVTVFEDSFRELYRRNPEEWKNRFYIVFEDEEGQDAGGLLREWYVIISREIFNPMYALFTVSPGDRVTYMINPSSHANSNHLFYFKFVGRVIAKAIYDNKLLECYFTRSFYKHILGIEVNTQDMENEDYEFYKGLVYLMENHVSALGYEQTFSLEVQEFGVTEVRDLIPNGRNIIVTEENKFSYIHLVCQLKMSGSIKQQLNAFLEGFYDIIPKRLISIFNEQELELLISGLPNVDIEDLKANTEYHKYQANSIQIQWFWRALRSFDQADRAKFLQFVTGTSKVPLQGFGALEGMNGVQKFQIHRDDRSTERLPSAHTCFNQLDLPVYKTYDKLRSSLLKAIHECSEGFGFA